MSWIDNAIVKTSEQREAEKKKSERSILKMAKMENIFSSVITTDKGNTFDSDETSQNRMVRTIISSSSDDDDIIWTMHDNNKVTITIRELKTALKLACESFSKVILSDTIISNGKNDNGKKISG